MTFGSSICARTPKPSLRSTSTPSPRCGRPDGKRLAFDRVEADGETIIAKDVSGSGAEEVLFKLRIQRENAGGEVKPQELYPIGWTPDGKYLIYRGPGEVSALAVDGSRKSTPLFSAKLATLGVGTLGVEMSPDGRWLAYSSNESGLAEVYVVPFRTDRTGLQPSRAANGRYRTGAGRPGWRGDGKELFFTNSFSVHADVRQHSARSATIFTATSPNLFSNSTPIRS